MAGSGPNDSKGSAEKSSGPSASYAGKIVARIRPNIVLTEVVSGNPAAEVEVHIAPDGSVLSRRLVKTSGYSAWDEAVLRAIDKTDKIPRDNDGTVPSLMILSFRPKD